MQDIQRTSSLIFLHSSVRIIRPGDLSTLSRTILTFIPSPALTNRGGSILHEDTVRNRYSYDEPQNLSCAREYRAFQLLQLLRSSRLFEADPSSGLWPSPFSKGELADRYSQRVSPSRPVISSGVSMLHEDTVKNRYSFEEPRNLSCGRECRAFQFPPPLRGKCTLSRLRRFHQLTPPWREPLPREEASCRVNFSLGK